MGYWPEALTHAAVTLIPKGEGCEPLNQRPLPILPIIYRVWAAARCSQCNVWQEDWITDGQHGARVKHGTTDALLPITAEMELAMLNGNRVYGAALDLSKAFDNIPQAITLEILMRMGMSWRILNPLKDMYGRLKRYFKIRGYLGSPFTATNGIMQGCPMSVLMLNALIGVLARVLHRGVSPLINQSFVDDVTLLAKTEDKLQAAFDLVDPFLRLTDQKLNVGKTNTFGINTGNFQIVYRGEQVAIKEVVKILGLKLRFANQKVSYKYQPEDITFLDPACSKIRNVSLPFWGRALVAGGAVVCKIVYASVIRVQERKIKAQILAAIWGGNTGSRKRTPGVAYTLFMKGHVADISQAALTTRWLSYMRAVRNDPSLAQVIWNSRRHSLFRVQGRGPAEALLLASQRLHFDWYEGTKVEINNKTFGLTNCEAAHFAHELREQARKMVWSQTRSDTRRYSGDQLPHLGDIGLPDGVDRKATMALYNATKHRGDQGVLRVILCNGVWTASSRSRLPGNFQMPPTCPFCNSGEHETLEHLWWRCSAWTTSRTAAFPEYPNEIEALNFGEWPRCTVTCGIKNLGTEIGDDVIICAQKMMVAIFKQREGYK